MIRIKQKTIFWGRKEKYILANCGTLYALPMTSVSDQQTYATNFVTKYAADSLNTD
jgi:hypothetical protein